MEKKERKVAEKPSKEDRLDRMKVQRGPVKRYKLTPEEQEHRRWDRENRRREKEEARIEKERQKQQKLDNQREKTILTFMLKNDVLYYHHGTSDSMKKEIEEKLQYLAERNTHQEYNPYIWNYQGEGNNYMSLCQFGRLWRNTLGFASIYDVPLDGSYIFYSYDSGQRGSGSFHYITVRAASDKESVPYVNPGGFPPVSV